MNRPAAMLLIALLAASLATGCLFDQKPKKKQVANATAPINRTADFIAVNSPSPGLFIGGVANISWRASRALSVELSSDGGRRWAPAGAPMPNASWLLFNTSRYPDGTRIAFKFFDPKNSSFATTIGSVVVDNTPPTAYCGPSYGVEEGGTVQVSGALSSDATSGVAAYNWSFGKGASPQAGGGQNFTVKAAGAGSFPIPVALEATDRAGNFGSANCTILASNVAPKVTITASANATEGTPVNFTAEFSDPGSEFGENYTVEWFFGDGLRGTGRQASHAYAVTAPYNLYNATTVVSDGEGYGNATVQVNVSNYKPYPRGFDFVEIEGQLLVFTWQADHPAGITLFSKIEYYDNVTSQNPPHKWNTACTQYGHPYQCQWNASNLATLGIYPLRLTVSDGIGETTLYGSRNYTKGRTAWMTT